MHHACKCRTDQIKCHLPLHGYWRSGSKIKLRFCLERLYLSIHFVNLCMCVYLLAINVVCMYDINNSIWGFSDVFSILKHPQRTGTGFIIQFSSYVNYYICKEEWNKCFRRGAQRSRRLTSRKNTKICSSQFPLMAAVTFCTLCSTVVIL